MTKTAMIALLALTFIGCAHPWNTAHTALEAVAEAANTVDEIAVVALETSGDAEEARALVVAQAQADVEAGTAASVEEYLERYDEQMENWRAVSTSLVTIREALILAEASLEVWRSTRERPREWEAICEQVGVAAASLTRLLDELEVEQAENWRRAQGYLEPVCRLITN